LDDAASPPPTAPSESHVTVAVRIKPTDGAKTLMRFGPRAENALRFTHVEGGRSDEAKAFAYDHVFDQAESQSDVYRALGAKVLSEVVSGHNASVFAYGQTGSGKTHTMLVRCRHSNRQALTQQSCAACSVACACATVGRARRRSAV
jgi:hypothetical protein